MGKDFGRTRQTSDRRVDLTPGTVPHGQEESLSSVIRYSKAAHFSLGLSGPGPQSSHRRRSRPREEEEEPGR